MSEGQSPPELRDLDSVDPCKEGRLVTGDSAEPSADGIVLLDHNFNVRQINTVASRIMSLTGAGSSSPLGRNIADLLGGDRSNAMYQQCEAVIKTGEPLTVHRALGNTANGNRSLRITIFRTETGLGMVVSDITEHERAENALRQSEQRYRLVVENANEAIIVVQDGLVKLINDKAAKIAGYSREDLISKPFPDFLHPDDRRMAADRLSRRLTGDDAPDTYELRVFTKRGETRWVETSAVALEWEGRTASLNFVSDVTEHREAEEALRESELRFRNVLDNSLDMIYQLDLDSGTYDYLSPASARVTGYTPTEFLGLTFEASASLVHPDDIERLATNIVELLSQTQDPSHSSSIEYRFRHKKLGYRWMSDTRSLVLDDHNTPKAVAGTLRDITDRKRADEAIRASEAQFRSVFAYAAMGIVLLDPDRHFVRINPAFRHMLGYSVKELRSMAHSEYVHSDDIAIDTALFTDLIKGSRNHYQVEKRLIDKHGRSIRCRVTVSAVRDFGGQLLYAIAMVEDTTERRLAEEALRRSEERFRALIENTQDVIAVINEDGTIGFNSPSVEKVLGYSPDELEGIDFFGFIHPEDRQPALDAFVRLNTRTDEPLTHQVRVRHGDGSWHSVEVIAKNLSADPAVGGIVVNFRDVTKRREAEDALRKAEAVLNEAQAVAHVGSWHLDMPGNMLLWSDETYRVFGVPKGTDMTYARFLECVHPEDREYVDARWTAALRGEPYDIEHRIVVGDEIRWVNERAHVEFDEGGNAIEATGTVHDITERRQAEQALRESERSYRILFDSVMEGLVVVDAETMRLVLANEAAAHMCDFDSVQQALSADFLEFVHPEDRERATRIMAEDMFEKDLRQVNEFRIITKRGNEKWISAVGTRIEYRGRVAGLGSFTDITSYKRAEAELRTHRNQLEQLVNKRTSDLTLVNFQLHRQIANRKKAERDLRIKDSAIASSINAIAISDTEGIILYVNSAFLTLWGYESESEVIGQSSETFWRMGSKVPGLLEAFGHMTNWTGELVAKRKDGTSFNVHVSASTIPDEDGTPSRFMASFIDVTDRKRNEAKLEKLYNREKRLRQQLEEEMNRRIEFTRALAHELKTPLTPVLMSSQILASQLKEPTMARLANNVARGASNLNSRIDELLDLARGEIGMLHLRLEQVDTLQLLREIIEDVVSVPASRNQSFASKLPPSLPPSLPHIWADRTRLRQIILNLLNNAFKYTPEGGKITLSASHDESNLIIEIHDTGPGISKQEQQRLFEPYHRIESDRERLSGLGLGLALSKTLVELHGGRIWVDSSATKGSIFAFSLPLQQPDSAHEQTP